MKDKQDTEKFKTYEERLAEARAREKAQRRAYGPSYYELERECRYRGALASALLILLALAVVVIGLILTAQPC